MSQHDDHRRALAAKVYRPMLQADIDSCTTEDLEAGAAIFDRVMAGCCQGCGKKAGCTCVYVASTPNNPLRTVIGFQNA